MVFWVKLILWQLQLAIRRCSVVTTVKISPPPRWLATTEPTPPPRCFTVFSAAFLGTVYCASVFYSATCSDSHLMSRHLILCETWMHAELVTPPALPPRVRFPTRAIRSTRRSSHEARTSLVAPASVQASSITCVQVLGPTVLAAAISIDRCYGRLCHLPPADAMIDITQVVLLSVRQELWS